MKTGVIGGGALGLLWAGRLAGGGLDVTVITRTEAQAERLRNKGLVFTGLDGEESLVDVRAKAISADPAGDPFDVLLVTVKQRHLPGLIDRLSPMSHEQSALVFFQNGWGHDREIRRLGAKAHTFAAVTTEGALRTGPNRVHHTGSGQTWVGPFPHEGEGEPSWLDAWIERVSAIDPEVKIHREHDIRSRMWEKLVINCAINAPTAILEIPNGDLLHERHAPLLRAVVEEAVRVAEAIGVRLDANRMLEKVVNVCRNTSGNRSSMLQDLMRGEPTEIDWINGTVVRLGERMGMDTPVNRQLVDRIREKERHLKA
ncbi:ketopantoate reductase family protein [Staphylospora marina]|uniref:ketopantoate reductase family protein n=1 Tax=Staphylospora marina TaxID=2490858 RepID=UPI0013DE2052|nr:2-dehydropantoate 2-reductase [Staphylospora marina]